MINKLKISIAAVLAGGTLLGGLALPAFAQVNVGGGLSVTAAATGSVGVGKLHAGIGANANANLTVRETQLVDRADAEITNRINALNALETRINAMVKLSSDEKASLSSSIQAQIAAMTTLQGQIASDQTSNNTSSLKIDVQSITKAYRIYALVLPQAHIAAASDRIMTIGDAMTTLSGTLQTRITAAQSAGANMSASLSALADMNAKVADANTQATAAIAHTSSLQPDNGDTTVMASNTAALKLARSDIQVAQKDLVTARTDAMTIIKAIKAAEKTTGSASVTASTTAGNQ